VPRFSVWVGDRHLFTPGGLELGDRATAVGWAAGYSASVDAEVAVLDAGRVIATFRRTAAPVLDAELRVIDARGVRPAPGGYVGVP
jgi:hypothetical protein